MECGWCFGPVAAAAKRREEQRGGEVGGEFRMVELPCGCCGSCYNDRVSCFGSWRGLTWTSLAFQDCPLKSSSCKDGYK
uniref:Uncharacterized protein n=1 Tax=Salix viminalis TaxID=40686 RepID=A0A6N2MNS4_SALVM